jgi:hypothetical protein
MWTLAFGHHEHRTPTHGYAATREAGVRQKLGAGVTAHHDPPQSRDHRPHE